MRRHISRSSRLGRNPPSNLGFRLGVRAGFVFHRAEPWMAGMLKPTAAGVMTLPPQRGDSLRTPGLYASIYVYALVCRSGGFLGARGHLRARLRSQLLFDAVFETVSFWRFARTFMWIRPLYVAAPNDSSFGSITTPHQMAAQEYAAISKLRIRKFRR